MCGAANVRWRAGGVQTQARLEVSTRTPPEALGRAGRVLAREHTRVVRFPGERLARRERSVAEFP